MMRRFALALLLLATPALAQSRAAPKSFTQDDLKKAEAARDAAVARLKQLEAKSNAVARDLSDIDSDLLAAASDSTAREEAAYAAEEQLMILADENRNRRQRPFRRSGRARRPARRPDDVRLAQAPALATSPEDSAAAVRAAILMSDTAPALSQRAAELKQQIETLNRLAAETRQQQTNLASATGALSARREEINALAAEKRRALAALAAETDAARAESKRLADEAQTLRDLLDKLAKAAPARPSVKPPAGKPAATKPSTTKPSTAKPPAVAVKPSAASALSSPPSERLHRFGQILDGAKQEGLTLATRAAAQVVAPLDARVEYSGAFRSYGQMVILDVGDDVLVVVAGLDALYPEAGQWVLAGEPIGRMADRKSPSPELYLEVRRKGQPVDPEKWLGQRS